MKEKEIFERYRVLKIDKLENQAFVRDTSEIYKAIKCHVTADLFDVLTTHSYTISDGDFFLNFYQMFPTYLSKSSIVLSESG